MTDSSSHTHFPVAGRLRHLRPWLAAAVLACTAISSQAADAITDALQQAYVPYRAALFRTNGKSQSESEQALAAARRALAGVVTQWAAKPGAPYDRDPEFAATLKKVDEVYARAQAQIGRAELPEAHETLEAARDLLAELRRRNGVVTFSDHMNAYHEVMEQVLIGGPKTLDAPNGLLKLAADVGVLDHLAQRLGSQADATLAANPEFTKMLAALKASVAALKDAVLRQDAAAVREALNGLKKPYSQMFLKFG
jgi:phosphoglycolate phosphatase-like HAD superfamily hydrolase